MFNFLKDKLKKAVFAFSKKVEEEAVLEDSPDIIGTDSQKLPTEEIKKQNNGKIEDSEDADQEMVEALVSETSQERINEANELFVEKTREEEDAFKLEDEWLRDQEGELIEDSKDALVSDFVKQPELETEKFHISKQEEEIRLLQEKQFAEKDRKMREALERQSHADMLALQAKNKRKFEDEQALQRKILQEEEERQITITQKHKQDAEELQADEYKHQDIDGQQKKEKKSFFQKIFGRKKDESVAEQPSAKLVLTRTEFENVPSDYHTEGVHSDAAATDAALSIDEKKGFFSRVKDSITTVKLSSEKFNDLFEDLEILMLESNVAVEVIEKIKEDLRQELTSGKVSRKSVEQLIQESLKISVQELFDVENFGFIERIKSSPQRPFVIVFVGVNGSGKTTTMAKIANLLQNNNLSVVFAASDTFRAAAIQQLQEHADRLGVKMIRHDYESDPAAVAYDAIKHAQAKKIDVVLIDTAGRLHTNDNLMNELKKLIRVNKPDMKIFIGEAITGNDCVEQAKLFNNAVGIDGIILAKADVDEKGGAALSVAFITGKPILYFGTGQGYDDLMPFDSKMVIKSIGL